MIFIQVALMAEARPLVKRFQLKAKKSKPFAIYTNDNLWLIVSGSGKTLAAAATAYLFATAEKTPMAFINFGIAKHALEPVGTVILGHKIMDRSSQKSYYPSLMFEIPCPTKNIITVENLSKDYTDDGCYETEAAGSFLAASRFLPFEVIHSVKIISNNNKEKFCCLTERKIASLIEDNFEMLLIVTEEILKAAQEFTALPSKDSELFAITQNWHFSVSEKYKLKEIVNNIKALKPDTKVKDIDLNECNSAEEVLHCLKKKMQKKPFLFSSQKIWD